MSTIFLTGFPGFLGSALIKNMLAHLPDDTEIACLVQAKFRPTAEARVAQITALHPHRHGRVRLYNGDITRPDLGLGSRYDRLQAETTQIFHLAAVYDLGVQRELAHRVNVRGTEYMLQFARGCSRLTRFQYVSTCYVSGRHRGTFTEDDLVRGQTFNNYYEETKYLAEVAVQKEMHHGLPVTIYRPAITLGDSRTGRTQKYDGPYYILQWILRQPALAFVPVVGNTRRYEVNIVPSNYVVDAITYLSRQSKSVNRVYHLSDPDPLTVNEILELLAEVTGRHLVRVPVPKSIAKGALERITAVQQLMRIEPEAVEYFIHPTRYTCEHTLADLAGTGIVCPPFPSYAAELIHFMETHPDIPSAAMV